MQHWKKSIEFYKENKQKEVITNREVLMESELTDDLQSEDQQEGNGRSPV